MYFNIVTIINFVLNIVIFVTSGCLFKEKGWFYRSVVGIFQSLFRDLPTANALDFLPDETIEITLLTPITRFSFHSMDNTVTETLASLPLQIVLSILAGLLLLLLIGILIYFFVIPLTQCSSMLRHCQNLSQIIRPFNSHH